MKKLLTVLITWCLLLLLGCGVLLLVTAPKEATVSESENRMLEAFPSADLKNLLSGGFSGGGRRKEFYAPTQYEQETFIPCTGAGDRAGFAVRIRSTRGQPDQGFDGAERL